MTTEIRASRLAGLLEILYVLVIAYHETGESKASADVAEELKDLAPSLKKWPELDGLGPAFKAVISGRNVVDALVVLGNEIKSEYDKFHQDSSFRAAELEVLKAVGLYLRSDSESAWNKLVKMASITGSPWVARKLDQGHSKQETGDLREVVYQLVGRDDVNLTLDEAKTAKETQPELYQAFLALRKNYNQSWKDAIASYVRKSGKKLVPMKELDAYFKDQGIKHGMPTGFTGLVDDQGRWYTLKGDLIDGVPAAVSFPSVKMNRTYGQQGGGDAVFMAVGDGGARTSYFYTLKFKQAQAKAKFDKVKGLTEKMPKLRAKWFAAVRKFNPEKPQDVAAVILEILYQFSARIGSVGNAAAGASTYGVGTLLAKHATVMPNNDVVLKYKGKDGVATRHVIKASDPEMKYVAAALHLMLENKDPRVRIFTYEKGDRDLIVTPQMVNAYFQHLGAGDLTVHKIRTYHATRIFNEQFAALSTRARNAVKTDKDALALIKKMAEAVGKALNHVRRSADGSQKVTGTTALSAYIDAASQVEFFRSFGLRPPKYLEKQIGGE